MGGCQLVVFNIDGESFGVEITHVKEIIKMQEIFKIPNTPEFIEGLISLRGKVHTIFNLRKKFRLPAIEFDDNTNIILVNVKDALVGFIVDEVNEIVRFEDEDIEMTPDAISRFDRKYLNGIAKMGEKIVMILNLDEVLSYTQEKVAAKA